MDLKGISWVGNFYQKFEAMCLEVEEIMYQDTVKYVENQVQTVGSSMKKFYSDVMQDLLPPSTVDSAKGEDSDLPLDFYADVGIYMKPKLGMMEKHVKVDDLKKLTEDQKKTINYNSDYPPTFHRVCHVDNLFPLSQEDSAGGALRQNGKGSLSNISNLRTRKNSRRDNISLNEKSGAIPPLSLNRASSFCEPSNENYRGDSASRASKQKVEGRLSNKSNLGTSEKSKRRNMSHDEISRVDTPMDKDMTRASTVCKVSNENHNSFDQIVKVTTPGSIEEKGPNFIVESNKEIKVVSEQMPDILTDGPSTDVVDLAESGVSKEMDMRASSCGTSSVEASDVCRNDGVISLVESHSNWQVQPSEIACEEDFVSNSGKIGDSNTEVNEVDTFIVDEMEIIQQVDKAKLEESCIMVDRDDFHFVPCYKGKSKSYQKKIRNVFSPRKNSMRKYEYEQLAIWPDSGSNPNQEECDRNSIPSLTVKDDKRSPTADFCEAEWELL